MPLNERLAVYGQICGYNYKNRDLFEKSVRKLRSLNLRVIYDYLLILEVERAEDHQDYDPCVVLAYARLYDDFRLKNSPDTFDVGILSGIVNMASSKKVLDLNYGLTNGKSYRIRDVASILNMSVAECKEIKASSLQILQQIYCY